MHTTRRLSAAGATLIATFWLHDARAEEQWSFELVPFVWASGLDGEQRIGEVTANIDAPFSDLIHFVNIGGWLRFSAHREPWSTYAEIAYVELEEDGIGPLGNTKVTVTQTLGEAGVGYWFSDKFSVYGGLRYQDVDNQIGIGSVAAQDSANWVDGVVGVQLTPVASDHWLLWLRGDVGGGSSELVWLAETGVGWSWDEPYALYVAYRLLDTDYRTNTFAYHMQQSGFLLGFGFRF